MYVPTTHLKQRQTSSSASLTMEEDYAQAELVGNDAGQNLGG